MTKSQTPLTDGIQMIHTGIRTMLQIAANDAAVNALSNSDYLSYVRSVLKIIHVHHHTEDEKLFPRLREHYGDKISEWANDHEDLSKLLEEIDGALGARDERINVKQVQELLRGIYDMLDPHLKKEEMFMGSGCVNEKFTLKELAVLAKEEGNMAKKSLKSPQVEIPILFYSVGNENRASLKADLPFILTGILVPIIWTGKYKKYLPVLPFHPKNQNIALQEIALAEEERTRANVKAGASSTSSAPVEAQ